MSRIWLAAIVLASAALAAGAQAKNAKKFDGKRPEVVDALLRCRALKEDGARLACFDAAAASFESAAQNRDVVVIDRKQVRESKRTLFGFDLPRLPFFGDDDDDADQVKSVEGVVAAASTDGNGRWIVQLKDGGTWHQIDSEPLALRPRAGSKVKITRASLGSYMMRVDNQPGIRVRRTS